MDSLSVNLDGIPTEIKRLKIDLKDEGSRQVLIDDNFQAALDQLEQRNPAAKSKLFEKIKI